MPTNRRIVIANLDESSRAIVRQCLPPDHFEITEFDASKRASSSARVDLVIFLASRDLEDTQAFCSTLRSHVGQGTPLLCCAGRYVYPLIIQLLGNAMQCMIMTPFDAGELREKLNELDLGF